MSSQEIERQLAFNKSRQFWENKLLQQGEGYVGRIKEDHSLQQKRIESIVISRLKPSDHFPSALDFGCGYGRFIPHLSQFCGHLYAVDILRSMLDKAKAQNPYITAIEVVSPFKLPFRKPKIDFLWSCLVLQHVTESAAFDEITTELKRVMKSGARVLLIDNGVDTAPHVKVRGSAVLASALDLRPGWFTQQVTINQRSNDHFLLDGFKA